MKMCTPTRWLGARARARAVALGRSDWSCFQSQSQPKFRKQGISITVSATATARGTRPLSLLCSYSSPVILSSSMPYEKELAAAKKAATLAAHLCQAHPISLSGPQFFPLKL